MNKTFSNKSDTNHQEKIILNKRSDLINIPIQQLRTAKLKNFSGTLFDQIYKEAIAFEHNQDNKNQFLESRRHSRSFAYKKPKEIANNNFNGNNYIDNNTNIFEKNKMIRIINKKLNINKVQAEKEIAKLGGHAAKSARDDLEKNLGRTVITSNNNLNYRYIDDNRKIENK